MPDEKSAVDRHQCHIAAKFGVFVDEDHSKLHTLYWSPKLHKDAISRVLLLTLTHVLLLICHLILTSCLTAIKNHVLEYCETVFERNGKIYLGLLRTQARFLTN